MKKVLISALAALACCAALASDLAGRFYSGGTVVMLGDEHAVSESGVKNGVYYRFYFVDHEATFGGYPEYRGQSDPLKPGYQWLWRVACETDANSAAKTCMLSRGSLTIGLRTSGSLLIAVGGTNFPAKPISLQVDKQQAVTTTHDMFRRKQADTLIGQMREGKLLSAHYYPWPGDSKEEETIDLFGFNEAMDYMQWAVQQD